MFSYSIIKKKPQKTLFGHKSSFKKNKKQLKINKTNRELVFFRCTFFIKTIPSLLNVEDNKTQTLLFALSYFGTILKTDTSKKYTSLIIFMETHSVFYKN